MTGGTHPGFKVAVDARDVDLPPIIGGPMALDAPVDSDNRDYLAVKVSRGRV